MLSLLPGSGEERQPVCCYSFEAGEAFSVDGGYPLGRKEQVNAAARDCVQFVFSNSADGN